jgi:hypothetical protein
MQLEHAALFLYPKTTYMKKVPAFLLPFFFMAALCNGQTAVPATDSLVTIPAKKIFTVSAAVSYIPELNYFGRTDSLKSSALVPSVIINAGKHFSFTPSLIFIQNKQASFDYAAATVDITYSFGKQKKGIGGTIYADKFFYKGESKLVRAAQQGQAGFTLSHYNKIVNITAGASAAFTKDDPDYFATAGLEHKFRYQKKKNIFLIVPVATANAGTQHFTNSYYKKNNWLILPASEQLVTENSKKFYLLSYDLNLSLIYARNRFIGALTPGYVIPQNVLSANGATINSSNLFYCNAVVIYKLVK